MKMSQSKSRFPPKIPYTKSRHTLILWKKGGKKSLGLIHLVDSAWNIVKRSYRGSSEKAAKDVKVVGARTLERLASIAELPERIVQSLGRKEIGIDVASSIAGLKDFKLQTRVAKVVAHMNAHDARQIVNFARRWPNTSLEEFKRQLLEAKEKNQKLCEIIMFVNENEFTKLEEEATKLNIKWNELCTRIIKDWLGDREQL